VPSKTYEEIYKEVQGKSYHSLYLLQGEEPYYIDKISDLIENTVLDEAEKGFNQTILYGRDVDKLQLTSLAKGFPMMGNHQVIIIKEAQEFKAFSRGKSADDDESSDSGKDNDPFVNYLNNPLPSTILVFCFKYKTLDKRSKVYKAIEKKGIVYESKKINESKLAEWIEKYVVSKKYKIVPAAAKLMADYLGNDLSKVVNEVDKLTITLKEGTTIDASHIEKNIGISKDFNIFELQNALSRKDIVKATQIVNYFRANPKSNPFVLTIYNLFSYFSKILLYHTLTDKSQGNVASKLKINPYFVRDYETAARNYSINKAAFVISYLRDYDLKSKGHNNSSASDGDLLRELVFKILH
jgi:DNA polymerase-3 subunit delta